METYIISHGERGGNNFYRLPDSGVLGIQDVFSCWVSNPDQATRFVNKVELKIACEIIKSKVRRDKIITITKDTTREQEDESWWTAVKGYQLVAEYNATLNGFIVIEFITRYKKIMGDIGLGAACEILSYYEYGGNTKEVRLAKFNWV